MIVERLAVLSSVPGDVFPQSHARSNSSAATSVPTSPASQRTKEERKAQARRRAAAVAAAERRGVLTASARAIPCSAFWTRAPHMADRDGMSKNECSGCVVALGDLQCTRSSMLTVRWIHCLHLRTDPFRRSFATSPQPAPACARPDEQSNRHRNALLVLRGLAEAHRARQLFCFDRTVDQRHQEESVSVARRHLIPAGPLAATVSSRVSTSWMESRSG